MAIHDPNRSATDPCCSTTGPCRLPYQLQLQSVVDVRNTECPYCIDDLKEFVSDNTPALAQSVAEANSLQLPITGYIRFTCGHGCHPPCFMQATRYEVAHGRDLLCPLCRAPVEMEELIHVLPIGSTSAQTTDFAIYVAPTHDDAIGDQQVVDVRHQIQRTPLWLATARCTVVCVILGIITLMITTIPVLIIIVLIRK